MADGKVSDQQVNVEFYNCAILIVKLTDKFSNHDYFKHARKQIHNCLKNGIKKIIIDLTQLSYLPTDIATDLYKISLLFKRSGGNIKLIVAEDKPRTEFSIGSPIANLEVYLTRAEAFA